MKVYQFSHFHVASIIYTVYSPVQFYKQYFRNHAFSVTGSSIQRYYLGRCLNSWKEISARITYEICLYMSIYDILQYKPLNLGTSLHFKVEEIAQYSVTTKRTYVIIYSAYITQFLTKLQCFILWLDFGWHILLFQSRFRFQCHICLCLENTNLNKIAVKQAPLNC